MRAVDQIHQWQDDAEERHREPRAAEHERAMETQAEPAQRDRKQSHGRRSRQEQRAVLLQQPKDEWHAVRATRVSVLRGRPGAEQCRAR